jgi:DNA-binding IclR family transcriptional regulator
MTAVQLDLFSRPPRAFARRSDPPTAHVAAASVPVRDREYQVLAALSLYGPLTAHEIAEHTELPLVSVSPRMKPLETRGLVVRDGRRDKRTIWRACAIVD